MDLKEGLTTAWAQWQSLTLYQRFEHAVIVFLSGLMSVVVVMAVWNLLLKVVASVMLSDDFDPTEYSMFQVLLLLAILRKLMIIDLSANRCRPSVRAFGRDPRAWCRVLARAPPGSV